MRRGWSYLSIIDFKNIFIVRTFTFPVITYECFFILGWEKSLQSTETFRQANSKEKQTKSYFLEHPQKRLVWKISVTFLVPVILMQKIAAISQLYLTKDIDNVTGYM
jgi:hypothetical protein